MLCPRTFSLIFAMAARRVSRPLAEQVLARLASIESSLGKPWSWEVALLTAANSITKEATDVPRTVSIWDALGRVDPKVERHWADKGFKATWVKGVIHLESLPGPNSITTPLQPSPSLPRPRPPHTSPLITIPSQSFLRQPPPPPSANLPRGLPRVLPNSITPSTQIDASREDVLHKSPGPAHEGMRNSGSRDIPQNDLHKSPTPACEVMSTSGFQDVSKHDLHLSTSPEHEVIKLSGFQDDFRHVFHKYPGPANEKMLSSGHHDAPKTDSLKYPAQALGIISGFHNVFRN